ncbi:MAG: gamma-glutamylcyclotransferase [Actinophytocola sp.]|uniref:gamma-glutamylcyclotransferase n=1 Tax=Actinophytocola sp. TaxID=1872138 RepID=UPI003C752EDB
MLDRVPASRAAAVTGWRVAALRDHVYPALVPAGTNASGRLLTDLSRAEWQLLDAFEDDLYDLTRLTLDDGQHGWAYVSDANGEILPVDWDATEFTNCELRSYVERCGRWRRWYEQRQSDEDAS